LNVSQTSLSTKDKSLLEMAYDTNPVLNSDKKRLSQPPLDKESTTINNNIVININNHGPIKASRGIRKQMT